MLVLTRKLGEEIVIGGNISIKVVDVHLGKVKLGILAPPEIQIMRAEVVPERQLAELHERIARINRLLGGR